MIHYVDLPFTLLTDRDGKAIQRWTGFAGAEQIQAIRSAITAELARTPPAPHHAH